MPVLQSIPLVPREVQVALAVAVVLLVLGLWVHYSRRHYVVIRKSDTTEMIAFQLGRIADALGRLERLAAPPETQPLEEQRPPERPTPWLSLFGR